MANGQWLKAKNRMAGFKPFTPRPAAPRPAGNQPARGRRPEKENPHRINEEITADSVRIVGDNVEPNLVLPDRKSTRLNSSHTE